MRTTAVDWPELPEDLRASGVRAIQVPGPAASVTPAVVPAQPAYPVWPPLPEPVVVPEPPADIEPQRTEALAPQRIPDPDGPGCGWDFAATMAPEYDEAEVRAVNAEALRRTRAELAADGARWQSDVVDYWVAYAAYVDDVEAYRGLLRRGRPGRLAPGTRSRPTGPTTSRDGGLAKRRAGPHRT